MRVLLLHNHYRFAGGEDSVFANEAGQLEALGHQVFRFVRGNDQVGEIARSAVARRAIWSSEAASALRRAIADFRPDVLHAHNTFPLISPAAAWVAQSAGVPFVQTLHNFRILCPQAMFFRAGRICEDCLGRVPWRAVLHGCYRASRLQSAAAASVPIVHAALGTFQSKVSRYVAVTEFARGKFIEGGLPASRIVVKPHFTMRPDPASESEVQGRSGGLYVGRLSPEKGIDVLAAAQRLVPEAGLVVIGDGPLADRARIAFGDRYLGFQPPQKVFEAMRRAAFLVVPSLWYEMFGMVVVEAFARGLPVIASRLGALQEIVRERVTGLLFTPDDPGDLARKIEWALRHPDAMREMGRAARAEYEERYAPEANCRQLVRIYEAVVEQRAAASFPPA